MVFSKKVILEIAEQPSSLTQCSHDTRLHYADTAVPSVAPHVCGAMLGIGECPGRAAIWQDWLRGCVCKECGHTGSSEKAAPWWSKGPSLS